VHRQATTLGKLLTPMCLCHQADFSGLSIYGLTAKVREMSTPPAPIRAWSAFYTTYSGTVQISLLLSSCASQWEGFSARQSQVNFCYCSCCCHVHHMPHTGQPVHRQTAIHFCVDSRVVIHHLKDRHVKSLKWNLNSMQHIQYMQQFPNTNKERKNQKT